MDAFTFTFSANGTPPKQTCKQCRLRKVRCQGQRASGQPCTNCERLEFTCSFSENVPVDASNVIDKPEPRRISKACARCRQQKIRCSGTTPCASCRRKDLSCDYPTSARRKTRARALSGSMSGDDYGPQDGGDQDSATPQPPPQPQPPPPPPAPSAPQQHQPQPEDHAMLDRRNTGDSFPPTFTTTTDPTLTQVSPPSASSGTTSPAVARLFDFFFQHVYPLPSYAFLHPATTRRRFDQARLDHCLVHAISAVASIRAPTHLRCADMEVSWAEQAEAHVWQHLESPSIVRLQTILLVVLFRIETGQLRRAFMLSSLAGRAAAAMRLNHERPGNGTVSHEVRRRLMWSLKFVERYFSHGLPEFELCPVDNLYIQLPSSEIDFNEPSDPTSGMDDLGAYRTCVKLEMLRRDIMKLTRSLSLRDEPYPQLPQLMQEFQDNLDKIEKQLPEGSSTATPALTDLLGDRWLPRHLLMRLSWHQCHCDLYRLILRNFREAAPRVVVDYLDISVLDAAEQQCIHHSKSIAQTLTLINQESQQARLLEFDSAICAYNASRLLLFTARFGQTVHRPNEDFALSRAELCLTSLRRFFPRSPLVKPIADEMRRLIDEAASNSHIAPSRLGSPRSSMLHDRDPALQLSSAAKARQRLAIHSLLRQAGFSDDEDEPEDVGSTTEKPLSSPNNLVSPGMMSSVSQVSATKVHQGDGYGSREGGASRGLEDNHRAMLGITSRREDGGGKPMDHLAKDQTTPETAFDTEAWQHSLVAGDLLGGWDVENAAAITGAPSVRSFTFPWLQREQADWEPEQPPETRS